MNITMNIQKAINGFCHSLESIINLQNHKIDQLLRILGGKIGCEYEQETTYENYKETLMEMMETIKSAEF